jgi:phage pi2 protein 07
MKTTMKEWAYSARLWRKRARYLQKLQRRADSLINELIGRNNIQFADNEIVMEYSMTELERYTQTSPADAFRQLLAAEKANWKLRQENAGNEFLADGKQEIWELFQSVREEFDGSEYQQGKKDGLRSALALLGNPEMVDFNRGNRNAREGGLNGEQ